MSVRGGGAPRPAKAAGAEALGAVEAMMQEQPIEEIKKDAQVVASAWKRSRTEPAGKRFKALRRLRRQRGACPGWLRALHYVLGAALVGLGVIFTFIPGPNWLFLIPGAVALATESGLAAAALDAAERAAQPAMRLARRAAKRMHPAARWAVLLACFAFASWLAWQVIGKDS